MTATAEFRGPEVVFRLADKRIWVTGHRGMVGSALVRRLEKKGCEILTAGREHVDLTRQASVESWMTAARPEAVVLAAARVGGILANATYPAEFLYDNLMIGANVLNAAYKTGVQKLLFLGSSCIYPTHAEQPISESALLTGPLEPTNAAYAIAKIAGLKLAQAYRCEHDCDFISAMPTNLYGPGDNFNLESSHVLPALLRKFHDAKQTKAPTVTIWGSGTPRREFLHVDDLADACVFVMERYSDGEPVNIGVGEDVTIRELAGIIADVVGYHGILTYDGTKPDGTPRKRLDVGRLAALGWRSRIALRDGIAQTYEWYLRNRFEVRE